MPLLRSQKMPRQDAGVVSRQREGEQGHHGTPSLLRFQSPQRLFLPKPSLPAANDLAFIVSQTPFFLDWRTLAGSEQGWDFRFLFVPEWGIAASHVHTKTAPDSGKMLHRNF